MKEIRICRPAVQISSWATSSGDTGQLVVIEQVREAAVLTVAMPLRITRLASAVGPGVAAAGPLAILATELVRAAAGYVPAAGDDRPLAVMQLAPELAAVLIPSGSPSTVAIVQVSLPDATGVIDVTEGEAASGMTKATAIVPPEYLRQVADLASDISCTAVEIIFAPRFGSMLATAKAPGCTGTFVISTDGRELVKSSPTPEVACNCSHVFKVQAPGRRAASKPANKKPDRLSFEDDLPF